MISTPRSLRALLFLCGAFSASPAAYAEQRPIEEWRERAAEYGLGTDQIAAVERDGFILVNEPVKQAYEIYAHEAAGLPPHTWIRSEHRNLILTSDLMIALVNASVDEALLIDEASQSRGVRDWLQKLWNQLPTSTVRGQADEIALLESGRHFAQFTLGVPLTLLGGELTGLDVSAQRRIEDEVRRIRAGEGAGKGRREIDYCRLKSPPAFQLSPILDGFYRVRQWLAQFRFEASSDEELVGLLILAELDGRRDEFSSDGLSSIANSLFHLDGSWPMFSFRFSPNLKLQANSITATLIEIRSALQTKATTSENKPLNRDSIRSRVASYAKRGFDIHDEADLAPQAFVNSLRASSPETTIDADRLSRTIAHWLKFSSFDSNDRDIRSESAQPELKDVSRFAPGGAYLLALQALATDPDATAPNVFRGEGWKTKRLQTALAGWSQFNIDRPIHTRVACCSSTGGGGRIVAIEPVPKFWNAISYCLEELSKHAGSGLRDARNIALAVEARWWADMLSKLGTDDPPEDLEAEVGELNDWFRHGKLQPELMARPPIAPEKTSPKPEPESVVYDSGSYSMEPVRTRAYVPLIAALADCASRWERGEALPYDAPPFGKRLWRSGTEFMQLAFDCRHIEALCQKQLRRVPFDDDDSFFLSSFSSRTARYCFDYSTGWSRVEDFGARVTAFPGQKGDRVPHLGTGRPATLYILYPVNDTMVLLRGAVLTYHAMDSDHPLSQEEWRRELTVNAARSKPLWLALPPGSKNDGRNAK